MDNEADKKAMKDFNKLNIVPTFSVVMIKKELMENVDFNVEFKPLLDWYLWSQVAKDNDFYYLDKKLTSWRMHKNSYISLQPTALQYYRWKRQLRNTLNHSNFIFDFFYFLNFIRKQIFHLSIKKRTFFLMGKRYQLGSQKNRI
jgi:hypothetical protein